MSDFDQKGQPVETQYNADTINIGIPLEKYTANLEKSEHEIRRKREKGV